MSFVCTANDKEHILFKSNGKYRIIPTTEIICIESNGRKVTMYTIYDVMESYQKISNLEQVLQKTFYRCHRCYIINMLYVEEYNSKYAKLKNGLRVPLSRKKISQFKNILTAYKNNN